MRFAEGIGLCALYSTTGMQWELVHAVMKTIIYWPVQLRMFDAVALPGNNVQLRLSTDSEAWKDIAFVPSHVPEGQGGEYVFTDQTASAFVGGCLEHHCCPRLFEECR